MIKAILMCQWHRVVRSYWIKDDLCIQTSIQEWYCPDTLRTSVKQITSFLVATLGHRSFQKICTVQKALLSQTVNSASRMYQLGFTRLNPYWAVVHINVEGNSQSQLHSGESSALGYERMDSAASVSLPLCLYCFYGKEDYSKLPLHPLFFGRVEHLITYHGRNCRGSNRRFSFLIRHGKVSLGVPRQIENAHL